MVMTYLWAVHASKDPVLKSKIESVLKSNTATEMTYIDMFRLIFNSNEQTLTVMPFSDTSDFRYKIIPTRIRYTAVYHMINGDWDHFEEGDVQALLD